MSTIKTLTRIPLLPEGMVLYPQERIVLDVSDDKFKQLVHECEENALHIGMVPVVRKRLFAYGTTANLLKVISREQNGDCRVLLEGVKIFRLRKFYDRFTESASYPGGDITYPREQEKLPSLFLQKLAERTFHQIEKLMLEKTGTLTTFPIKIEGERDERGGEELTSFYMLQRLVGLSLEEQAIYLAIRSEERRFTLLYDQLKRLLDVLKVVFK